MLCYGLQMLLSTYNLLFFLNYQTKVYRFKSSLHAFVVFVTLTAISVDNFGQDHMDLM